ncbi:MAG: C_GCAxxG_C_C family protein [Deltaproteobacteria bacterium]|nr:C_GCAxxG_C_C family protein [Deltaproteobacteria bacterium]
MENEDLLWAGIPFMGGIGSQQQAPCGAVTAAAIVLGLRYRCSLSDRAGAKKARNTVRYYAGKLVDAFSLEFGDITCIGLLGIDFSKQGEYKKFIQSLMWKDKCERYLQFIIEKLYEFEDERGNILTI